MTDIDKILADESDVLGFLRARYPIYHQSNVFFRDIQYGIQTLLERRGVRVRYTDAERAAREFIERLEKKKMLVPIDGQSWVVKNEEFKTVSAKKAAPAKPAPAKPAAAARPSGGLPPLKSATPAGGTKPAQLPPLKSSPAATAAKPGGLPPLKSSAPSSSKATIPGPKQEEKEEPAKADAPSTAKQEPAPKPKAPAGKKGELPPISSSVPAGSRK